MTIENILMTGRQPNNEAQARVVVEMLVEFGFSYDEIRECIERKKPCRLDLYRKVLSDKTH